MWSSSSFIISNPTKLAAAAAAEALVLSKKPAHHFRLLTCAASPADRLEPQPVDLIHWVRQQGAFVHPSLTITIGSHGVGLVATQRIPIGRDLIALPHHIPLPFYHLQQPVPPALLHLAQLIPEELWAMKLGLRLLHERAKRPASYWFPYFANLPLTYTLPIFFPGEDIQNLQYAPLLHQVNKRCRFLLDFEKQVKRVVEHLEGSDHPFSGIDPDANALGWAMAAVSSRAFRVYGAKNEDGTRVTAPMMLPVVDMCNHSFNPNAEIVQEQGIDNADMLLKVVAGKEIKQDDPVLLNYGGLSNDLFLLDYGFVIPSNPYDCIELRYDGGLLEAASMAVGVSSPNFSTPAPWQQRILSDLHLHGESPDLKVTLGGQGLVDGRLLAALRILLARDMETVQCHDLNTLQSLSVEAPLGIPNEVAALRTCIALCAIALQHFPTKLMDDEALLKKDVSTTTELALQFRIQKKSIIIHVMRDLSRRVKLLSSKESVASQN